MLQFWDQVLEFVCKHAIFSDDSAILVIAFRGCLCRDDCYFSCFGSVIWKKTCWLFCHSAPHNDVRQHMVCQLNVICYCYALSHITCTLTTGYVTQFQVIWTYLINVTSEIL